MFSIDREYATRGSTKKRCAASSGWKKLVASSVSPPNCTSLRHSAPSVFTQVRTCRPYSANARSPSAEAYSAEIDLQVVRPPVLLARQPGERRRLGIAIEPITHGIEVLQRRHALRLLADRRSLSTMSPALMSSRLAR